MEWINEFKKCQKKSRDTATLKTNPDPIEILQSWARDKVLSFSHKKTHNNIPMKRTFLVY